MKSIIFAICSLCAPVLATIQVDLCDPVTLERYSPCSYADIMMGMKIAVIVSSDSNDLWSGGVYIEGADRENGQLSGRGKDPNSRDWTKSHLPAAGEGAQVLQWKDSIRWGFDLHTDALARQQGRLFLIDYEALQPGTCTVSFYDYNNSWTLADPNVAIQFNATPTRDLNLDGIVNLVDFVIFSSDWQVYTGTDPNFFSLADFSRDGYVDLLDLCMFSDYWMYGIPGWKPKEKLPQPPLPEPEINYSIHTAEGLSELTLNVGDSVTLYIDQVCTSQNPSVIDLEVDISDPNLGWIDNTPIDPNNPPGPGTAKILFQPRDTFFDYWGPGMTQTNGIEFVGASMSTSIADGPIASFVYTATAEGTVVLNLCDYISFSKLENITIYQVDQQQNLTSGSQTYSAFASEEPLQTLSLQEDLSIASETGDSSTETTTVSQTTSETPDQLADFLEDIWKTDAQLRSAVDKQSWDEFVETVRNSEY